MLTGDFLDAMGGYNEGESERIKSIAELIRKSTSILWNIQVDRNNKLEPSELWPFAWDVKKDAVVEIISEEEKQRRQKEQDDFLIKNFPDGNGNQ